MSACFVPGDRHVLLGLKSGKMLIIDIAAGDILEEVEAHSKELWSISLLPDKVCDTFTYFNYRTKILYFCLKFTLVCANSEVVSQVEGIAL